MTLCELYEYDCADCKAAHDNVCVLDVCSEAHDEPVRCVECDECATCAYWVVL